MADRVLDESFSNALAGQSRDLEESSRALLFVFLLALALFYLVLAAQFESCRDPLTIIWSVSMSLATDLVHDALVRSKYYRSSAKLLRMSRESAIPPPFPSICPGFSLPEVLTCR